MPTRAQRLEGGIVGLLVGDALGVPYEFETPLPLDQIDFTPRPGHWHAWPGTPPGTWSDDGSQALCLLDSLLTCGRLDPDDLGQRLLRCHTVGYMWVDGRVFDTGVTTAEALRGLRDGKPALEAGPTRESSNGNGSLMRVLPLALWHKGTDAELIADARTQSRRHARPPAGAALLCVVLPVGAADAGGSGRPVGRGGDGGARGPRQRRGGAARAGCGDSAAGPPGGRDRAMSWTVCTRPAAPSRRGRMKRR